MEVKVFTKILQPKRGFLRSDDKSTDGGLEAEVNLWLASKPDIKVTNMTQSQSGGSWMPATLVVSLWYE
ncbi:MAG: hypothetical protein ACJAYG_001049 [Oceanicoccus sp.]|jgi:hypothetical protein